MPAAGTKRPSLINDQRRRVVDQLITRLDENYQLKHSAMTEVAKLFNCHQTTVSRIWSRADMKVVAGIVLVQDVSHNKTNSGRKTKYPELASSIALVPAYKRTTLHRLASLLDMPYSTLQWHYKRGVVVKHSSRVKPQPICRYGFSGR
jgi:hypothetical protein